ncbi:MAG: hypothetical protein VX438_00055 [Planctomycetota bacterium]|nr:hypothetical protein [Planctomycetota bacterium]
MIEPFVDLLMTAFENPNLVDELGLSKHQMNQLYRELNRAGRLFNRKTTDSNLKQTTKLSIQTKINQVLLTHQIIRVEQLVNQSRAIEHLPTLNLLSPASSEIFKLTPQDQAQLRKIAKDFKNQLAELVKQHRNSKTKLLLEQNQKIKALLKPVDQKKFDRWFGKPYWEFLDAYIELRLNQWPRDRQPR